MHKCEVAILSGKFRYSMKESPVSIAANEPSINTGIFTVSTAVKDPSVNTGISYLYSSRPCHQTAPPMWVVPLPASLVHCLPTVISEHTEVRFVTEHNIGMSLCTGTTCYPMLDIQH